MNDAYSNKDEIKLSEIFKVVARYLKEMLHFWWLILLFALLFGAYRYYTISNKEGYYTASLTFMLSSGTQGMATPLSGLMGQFGFGNSNNGSLAKMGQLMTSRKIILKSLFHEVEMEVDGKMKKDYFANHYIELLGMRDGWKENEVEALYDFRFQHAKTDSFSRRENSIANSIYNRITNFTPNGGMEKAHLSSNFAETDTEIVELIFSSTSEEFTKLYLNSLFDILGEYYVEGTIQQQLETYKLVRHRTDSLKSALTKKEYQLAGLKDSSKGIFKAKSYLSQGQLARDVGALQSMYMEAQRSLEASRIALQVKRPYVQVIDRPTYPIPYHDEGYYSGIFLGLVIGAVLAVVLILARRVIFDILEREKQEQEQEYG